MNTTSLKNPSFYFLHNTIPSADEMNHPEEYAPYTEEELKIKNAYDRWRLSMAMECAGRSLGISATDAEEEFCKLRDKYFYDEVIHTILRDKYEDNNKI